MKKLIVAVALVCAAAFAQAGTAKWTALNVQAAPSGAFTATTTYWGYVFDAKTYTVDTITALLATGKDGKADLETFAADAIAGAATSQTAAGTPLGMQFVTKTIESGVTGEKSYFVVLLDGAIDDAKYFQVAKVGGDGAETITQTVSSGSKTFAFGDQTKNTTWTAIAGAPEPTSGMLLLLGMGALALRRRRA